MSYNTRLACRLFALLMFLDCNQHAQQQILLVIRQSRGARKTYHVAAIPSDQPVCCIELVVRPSKTLTDSIPRGVDDARANKGSLEKKKKSYPDPERQKPQKNRARTFNFTFYAWIRANARRL